MKNLTQADKEAALRIHHNIKVIDLLADRAEEEDEFDREAELRAESERLSQDLRKIIF